VKRIDDALTKRYAPATERNRVAITEVLAQHLPNQGLVLEIASGTGEHVLHFARAFSGLSWQPSDVDEMGLASIRAWSDEAGLPNVLPPIPLDASASDWPITNADAILCINMIHIAPWVATQGLMAGAARILSPGGLLYLYGPYHEADMPTAESNEAFDISLKSRDPRWGLRNKEDVLELAADHGLSLQSRIAMPANNLSLCLRKKG
jgi:SAM-dependent methyltransferase